MHNLHQLFIYVCLLERQVIDYESGVLCIDEDVPRQTVLQLEDRCVPIRSRPLAEDMCEQEAYASSPPPHSSSLHLILLHFSLLW